eukprot:14318982-Alexandrium_andersonii.AAC.1
MSASLVGSEMCIRDSAISQTTAQLQHRLDINNQRILWPVYLSARGWLGMATYPTIRTKVSWELTSMQPQ